MVTTDEGHHPTGVRYEYFTTNPASPDFDTLVLPVATCYQQTYGFDPSWNEGRQCKACSRPRALKKWNLAVAPSHCDQCGGETVEFWPIAGIIADMRAELQKPDAVFVVARMGDEVVGCCWGFSADADEMEAHLNRGVDPEAQVPGIAEYFRTRHPGSRIGYQDEIFVKPGMQGFGIGRDLFRWRLEGFIARGLDVFALRTKMSPPASSYLWFRNRWNYDIIGRYPDEDQRVVLSATAEHIKRYAYR